MAYKCKSCGEEFADKGEELRHYKEFKNGACAEKTNEETVTQESVTEMQTKDPAVVSKTVDGAVNVLDASIEKQVAAIGRKTAEALKKEKQIKVQIPVDPLNKKVKYCVVGINGWNLQIAREKPVLLPESVVDLLAQGGYNPTYLRG